MSDILAAAAATGSAEEIVETPALVTAADEIPTEEPAAAAQATSPKGSDAPAAEKFESVQDFIMKGLADLDKPAVETPKEEPPPAKPAEEPKEEPKADDPEEPKPGSEDPKPADSETKVDDKDQDAAPPQSGKILTREEIDKQFPRTSKEIRDVAAANGEAALALQKQIDDEYGGTHFAEPMKLIAKGLLEDDNMPVISGVLAAQGVEGFTGLMKDVMTVALIDTQTATAKTDGEKFFQEACKDVADEIFKQKFGDGASVGLIEKLLKYEAEGLLNTADVDEYYQTGEGKSTPSPLLKEKEERIAELERKLGESEASGAEKIQTEQRRHDDHWEKSTNEASDKVLDDLFFSRSVLKVLETDSPEIKEGKLAAQVLLKNEAKNYRKADQTYSKLKTASFKGNGGTAKYKKEYSALVDAQLFETKKLAAPLEALISTIYSLSRNSNLPGTKKLAAPEASPPDPAAPEPKKEPTITKEADRPKMSREQWREHMERELVKS